VVASLVIGGNGFLGAHVVNELVGLGHEVSVFDRFSHESSTLPDTGIRRIKGEFSDPVALRSALEGHDHVAHFASATTPIDAAGDPSLEVRTNLAHSVELLQAAVDVGVKRVTFASSGGAIYGEHGAEKVSEQTVPYPISPYAIGKLAIEGYLRYFRVTHGLESVSLRISNPYGPGQHPHKRQGVIPIFLHRIAQGLPIPIFGDGSMVRDYLYVEDLARMVGATMESTPQHAIYNLGSGQGATVSTIVELCRTITNRPVEVERLPRPPAFVERVILDVDRFAAEFGVTATVPLETGIERTWRAASWS